MIAEDSSRNVYVLALVLGAYLVFGSVLGNGGIVPLILGAALLITAEALALSRARGVFGALLGFLALVVVVLPVCITLLIGVWALTKGYNEGVEVGRTAFVLVGLVGATWAALRWASYRINRLSAIDASD